MLTTILLGLALTAGACSPQTLAFSIGECVNLPSGEEISDFESVECDTAHDAEVFALPQHPDGEESPFPGATVLEQFANDRCLEAFEPYVGVGYEASAIYYTALTPSEDSWTAANDREVVCLLVGPPLGDQDFVERVREIATFDDGDDVLRQLGDRICTSLAEDDVDEEQVLQDTGYSDQQQEAIRAACAASDGEGGFLQLVGSKQGSEE